MLREERVAQELVESRRELAVARRLRRDGVTRMVGKSKPMRELFRQIERVASSVLGLTSEMFFASA